MDSVQTPKGTVLPLLNLKGKKYLQVAHRIQWFCEQENSFTVTTEYPVLTDEQSVVRATICVYGENGQLVKQATATKRETKKDFPDHLEKAETGAVGRALILLGYGTQFALSDLDEGMRLADSPVVDTKAVVETSTQEQPKKTSFRKPAAKKVVSETPVQDEQEWV